MSSLYEQIKADLGYLKLDAAAGVFATLAEEAKIEDWSHIEFLARLVAEQATADRDRRLAARLRYAMFPHRRSIDDFDYEFQPSVDRKLVEDLATLRFIDENRPILFLGQPGCGKTHLAVALATIAVEAGYRGYFTTADNRANRPAGRHGQMTRDWTSRSRGETAACGGGMSAISSLILDALFANEGSSSSRRSPARIASGDTSSGSRQSPAPASTARSALVN